MLSILVFLALVPLAILGGVILFRLAWILLPWAMVLLGLLVMFIMSDAAGMSDYAFVPGVVAVLGIVCIVARFNLRERRKQPLPSRETP